ncbi:MAG: hypothetical protein KKF62_13965 [Bacteroidetes bacterium]|nr:hypothetical protein [Bacteroidota bacterium]MBU1115268.1 hypothetical protein [Bacteroidota bacterium]MBU1798597.1 hypothetical protein [Bacteroidota bacterium]
MKKNLFLLKRIVLLFSLLTIFIFATACEDDPVAPQEEHLKAIGMVFYDSGIEVARIIRGVTSDTLKAPLGGLSEHYDIKFIDENENEFDPPSTETQTLAWEFADAAIADIWQHEGEDGSFAFHLQGLLVGKTSIEFFVKHNDHNDYRSGKIPVKVINETGTHGIAIGLELSDEETGNILVAINNSQVIGQLSVKTNETTDHFEVEFFDANNVHFVPVVPPHSLLVEVGDISIVQIVGQEADEPWAFKVAGLKSGSTTITIKILHDGNVGVTFAPITVNVN